MWLSLKSYTYVKSLLPFHFLEDLPSLERIIVFIYVQYLYSTFWNKNSVHGSLQNIKKLQPIKI